MIFLKNCRIIEDNKEFIKDILIEDGKIKQIGQEIDHPDPIDIHGKVVMPGIIDPHVHFREPGLTHKEDFYTGSCAAAAGGVTTFLDMPNTMPPTLTLDILDEKRELAEKSIVNFGFHFGASIDNLDEIETAKNIASIKIFMNLSTGKMMIENDDVLKEIFQAASIVTVHAEEDKVDKALSIAEETRSRLYLCHISKKSEIDSIREKKTEKIYAEVTPHHLFLDEKNDNDNYTKMKPPLRKKEDQDALWKAIHEGLIDTIGSDHAPHTMAEKDDQDIVYGVPGIETMLPLLLDAVHKGKISLPKIQELCCHNPAKIFGIKNKGFLKEGYDADLTIIDMGMVRYVDNSRLFTKCGWSPFHGRELKGWPVTTIVCGNVVYDKEEVFPRIKAREVDFE